MVPSYARKNNSCKEKFSPTSQRDVGENMCVSYGGGDQCLLDLQTAACGNLGSLLRHRQRQDAVSVGSLDTVDVDAGDVKAAAVRTVVTLALYEAVLLVLLILVDLSLGADGQAIVFDVYLDILLLEAGQLRRRISR